MKLEDAVLYVSERALLNGYTEQQISCFIWEVADRLNSLEDCSKEVLDEIYEELF